MKKSKPPSSTARTFYYFAQALWQHKFLTLVLIFTMTAYVLLYNILVPIGASEMIGKLSEGDFVFENYIPLLTFIIGIAALANLVLVRIADFITIALDAKCSFYLSNLAFNAVITQSMTFHNDHFSGSLTSQANKLPSAFSSLRGNITWELFPLIVHAIFTIGAIALVSPLYALILAATVVAYVTISVFTFQKTRHVDAALATAENRQTGQLADSITNISSVKSYAREDYERKRFARAARHTHNAAFDVAKVSFWRNSLLNVISLIAFISLLILIINGHALFGFTVANVVLLYILTDRLLNRMWNLNNILRTFNRALGDAKEMVEILDEPTAVVDRSDRALTVKSAEVNFHHISFTHADQTTPLFTDFSLKVPAGKRVGLVGVSGSGKTTLAKLLLRFADVQSGAILIDGQDISTVTQDSLRQNLAYVPQETALFHRSIAENIAYGQPDASQEQIRRAARLANAEEFIKCLPDGYETLVGERGVKLSGGQRQRIAIARAILKDAPILVLDEATSALDSESEALIQEALRELMKGRTSLVIAHRLSTVASLDHIVVLKGGKIVEQGTHRQLINRSGQYAKLWDRQTCAFIDIED